MQLKGNLTGVLSLASCSLLGVAHAATETPWDIDTAILLYTEADRVSALEPVISAKKEIDDDEFISYKLTLDTLTGASATGAVPSTQAQTFTRPSGDGEYQIDANETPLDDTFRDTRVQFTLGWDKPIDRQNRRTLGFNISREFDFTSISGNAGWTHELNQKNTSLNAAINIELDEIRPVGGTPLALSSQILGSPIQRDGNSESKQIIDLIFGVTQIIDRSSLFQVNLSHGISDGYLTDPYKLVSVVDTAVGANEGEPVNQIYENRPDSRSRTGIFTRYKKQFENRDIFNASFRFMTDDWGIDSQTFDVSYRFRFKSGYYLQPRIRLYQQTAADFYRFFLRDDEAVPTDVSADYRLGNLDAQTIGIKFGHANSQGDGWSVRLEQYVQSGDSSPSEAFGQLTSQDLYPDVEATIVQFAYSFQW